MDNNPVNRINHKMQIIPVRKKAEKKYEITRSHSGHSSWENRVWNLVAFPKIMKLGLGDSNCVANNPLQ